MGRSLSRDMNRVLSVLLSGTLLMAAFIVVANQVSATSNFDLTRFAGSNRYDTAKLTAAGAFTSADTALLSTGESFPDALAGGFLAGNSAGPILLTPKNSLSTFAKQSLADLKVKTVLILGGTGAVSTAVENELKATDTTNASGGKLTVERVTGTDRYATAKAIATRPGTTVGEVDTKKTAIVVTGDNFPDALAGGALSFAGKLPILLTNGAPSQTLNPNAKSALESLAIKKVLILGGAGAVSTQVEDEIKNTGGANNIETVRLFGSTRQETARVIAEYALANLGFVNTEVAVARGDGFADALSGGPHAGTRKSPVLLTVSATTLSSSSTTGAKRYLSDHSGTLTQGKIYGGTGAVSSSVESEAETAGGRTPGSPSPSPSGTTTPPAGPGPIAVSSVITDGTNPGNLANTLDNGDIFQFQFDSNIEVVSPSVQLADLDGTVGTVSSSNATFTVSADNAKILEVRMTGAVTPTNIGGTFGLNFGTGQLVAVRTSAGITETSGNNDWNLAASGLAQSNRSRVFSKDAAMTNATLRAIDATTTASAAAAKATISGTGGTNEEQSLSAGDRTGGTFTLTYNAATTAALAFNATAAQIQTALQALSTIGAGNATATGGPVGAGGSAVTITFVGQQGSGNTPQMTVNSSLSGGTTDPVVTTATQGARGLNWATGHATTVFAAASGKQLATGTVPEFGPLVLDLSPAAASGSIIHVVATGTGNTTQTPTKTLAVTVGT